jgi:hypothetical protein
VYGIDVILSSYISLAFAHEGIKKCPKEKRHEREPKRKKNSQKHTTLGIRWWSPTQLLIQRFQELSSWHGECQDCNTRNTEICNQMSSCFSVSNCIYMQQNKHGTFGMNICNKPSSSKFSVFKLQKHALIYACKKNLTWPSSL